MRRIVPDARQAEGTYWIVLVLLVATALFLGQWVWIGLAGGIGPAELLAAGAISVVLAAFCLGGWHPPIRATVDAERLLLQRGVETLDVPLADIASRQRVSAPEAHGHWLRYAATRSFINRMPDELLLLRCESGTPVLIGLPPTELARLEAALERGEEERVDIERMGVGSG